MARDKFYPVTNVPVTELLLDTNNPRIRHGEDQNDCIARILRERESFLSLLRDIADQGLSPEHILVSKSGDGKWSVRDGNRRITALKLLNRPELCYPDQALEQLVRRVAQAAKAGIPAAVTCLGCDSEAAILSYLERKHTGENAGVGQRQWSPLLKSLFNLQTGSPDPNKRAAQLVLWLEERGLQIEDDFPLTNLSRPLNNDTLGMIGFGILNDQLIPILPEQQAFALASRVVTDIASGHVHVRRDDSEGSIYSADAQRAYFRRVRAEIGPAEEPGNPEENENTTPSSSAGHQTPTRTADPEAPRAPRRQEAAEENSTAPPVRRPPSPTTPSWDRPGLFVRKHPGFGIPAGHTKVANTIAELKQLQIKVTPQAVAMVFRTLLELSEDHYRTRHDLPDAGSFTKRIAKAADHMRAANLLSESQHEVVISRSREQSGIIHATTLHKYVHSPDFHPNYQTLNTLWDEIGCFVAACWR